MPTEVVMPQMGESIAEGTIIKWHKKPGDSIDRDEPLLEITTDKVDTEVPAPSAGVVQKILVGEGETVAVGTVLAVLGDGSEPTEEAPTEAPAKAVAAESSTPPGGGHFRSAHEPTTFERAPAPKTTPPAQERAPRLSPAVLTLAAEHNIPMEELRNLSGTGRNGRLTKKDVESYLEHRSAPAAAAAPASTSSLAPSAPPAHYLYQPEPGDELVAMGQVRQQIAEHMVWSQQISAQVTSFSECDMHRIVRYQEEHQASFEQREGVPLTFLPFVAEATIRALKEFPIFNASVVGDQIAFKKHVHLGIAMSVDQGLIVPVIRNADEVNFIGLARRMHAMAEKAQTSGLAPEDVHGASFTVTNPGMFGGFMGTPMIAQPQVAILGLGAIQKKPVVIDDAIAIRPIMVLALTFDHRIIDGATGFQFLERIRLYLEQFDLES